MTASTATDDASAPVAVDPDDAPRPSRVRRVVSVCLAVLAVLIAVVDVPARYVENNVLDTEGYVDMVGPLAADPAVQATVSDAVAESVLEQLDLEAYATEALEGLAEGENVPDGVTFLAPVIAGQAENLVHRTTESLVSSEQFTALWLTANRSGHAVLISALEERDAGPVTVEDGVVAVPLDPIVERARDALVDRGFDAAASIEPQGRELVLVTSPELASAQKALSIFNGVSAGLPWLVLGLLVAAAWTAPRRRARTVAWTAGALTVVGLVLLAGIHLGTGAVLGNLPAGVSVDAVSAAASAFLTPLSTQLWWTVLLWALVTAAAAAWPWYAPRVHRRFAR